MRVAAAILGNALEFYDFTVYAAFAVLIGRNFFPSNDPTISLLLSVATFGVGFIARPLGGIVIGAYADRHGRRSAMTLTIWLMAIGSGLIGVIPTYHQVGVFAPVLLVFARLLQGFSAGGEMGPATTYLIESAPASRRAFFGSWQLSSQNMGVIISGIIGLVLALFLLPEAMAGWGWRVPFLLGILIAPVGYYIRRKLDETLRQEEAHETMGLVLADIVRNHRRDILLCILAISGATITQYFFIYTTTYALTELRYSQAVAQAANLIGGIVGAIFSVIGGLAADRFGVKAITIFPRVVLTLLLYPALMWIVNSGSPTVLLVVVGLLATLHAASGAAGIVLIPMIFPTAIRTTGLSIAYAFGVTIFGGTAQLVFTWLIGLTGNKLSWVWYIVAMSTIAVLATWAIRVPPTVGVSGAQGKR